MSRDVRFTAKSGIRCAERESLSAGVPQSQNKGRSRRLRLQQSDLGVSI